MSIIEFNKGVSGCNPGGFLHFSSPYYGLGQTK